MLSFQDYKKLNESVLGFGPMTLGVTTPSSLGVMGSHTEAKDEEPVDEEPKEDEKGKDKKKGKEKGKDKKDCAFCADEGLTKEDSDWWTSVHSMMGSDPNAKSWDGFGEEPKPGELGYAPVTRVGAFGEQVGPPADQGADAGPPPEGDEGGDGSEGGEGDEGDEKDQAISALLQAFGVEDTPENKDQVTQMMQALATGGEGGEQGPPPDMGGGMGGPAPGGPGGGPGAGPPPM